MKRKKAKIRKKFYPIIQRQKKITTKKKKKTKFHSIIQRQKSNNYKEKEDNNKKTQSFTQLFKAKRK